MPRARRTAESKTCVLAFSGGLDTTFCLVWLKAQGYRVITATVDTGGFSRDETRRIAARAKRAGSMRHLTLDRRREVYRDFLAHLIRGNVLKGGVYPLSVAAERTAQAQAVAEAARRAGTQVVAHGSTGAGNDQVRFDIAFSVLLPKAKILTPIRDLGWSREQEAEYLSDRGIPIDARTTRYSINAGLWGTTIGGGETRDSWGMPPESVYLKTAPVDKTPARPEEVVITFDQGLPTRLNGRAMEGIALVEGLNALGGRHGVGRGMHLGDTILGIKGRIAFEAPAALILVGAHRELEKLVLSQWQMFWKDHLGVFYGKMMHEGHYFDPAMRDIEALFAASQTRVAGDVRVRLFKGACQVVGARSPWSLLDRQVATYGEETRAWSADEARGFCKLFGMPETLAQRAAEKGRSRSRSKPLKKFPH